MIAVLTLKKIITVLCKRTCKPDKVTREICKRTGYCQSVLDDATALDEAGLVFKDDIDLNPIVYVKPRTRKINNL